MKIKKIEIRITYFILNLAIFLLNFKNISLLSIIISNILAILFILLFEKTNIYKYKLTKVILTFLSLFFLTYYLNKVTIFIGDNILREYSIIMISLTLLLAIFFLGNKGYHTIIKVILLASYFILFFLIIGYLTTIPYFEFKNITTKLFITNNLFLNTLKYTLLIIYTYFLIYPLSNTKFKTKDLIITTLYQLLTYLFIIGVLSLTLTNIYEYPYITIFKKVNLIGFIERIEILPSLNYLFIFFFLLLLSFYQIKYNLNILLKKKNLKYLLILLFILIFLLSLITPRYYILNHYLHSM